MQHGFALFLVVIVLLIVAASLLVIRGASTQDAQLERAIATRSGGSEIDRAISTFAAANKRLPCPASPTDSRGLEAAVTPYDSCTSPDGVLPWGSLGLPLDSALDKWSRKLSYRVYSGTTGFTRLNGLSAVDCNTSAMLTTTVIALDVNGQCATSIHGTKEGDFLAGKGLNVNDNGNVASGLAYVIISHGATGFGSFGADHSNVRKSLPNAAGKEYINATVPVNNTYWIVSASTSVSDSSLATFFDDVVSYRTADDLLRSSSLQARDWGWVTLAKAFAPTSFSPNAPTPGTSTLTITLTNSATTDATLTRDLVDTMPTDLVVAPMPAASTTCGGVGAISFTPGGSSITLPTGRTVPAATISSGIKSNGTCTISVNVTSNAVTTTSVTYTNTLTAGNTGCPTPPLTGVGYLCTNVGWNLAAASATVTATLTGPVLSSVSPASLTGSTLAQTITLTGTSFSAGATVTFVNVTAGTSATVAATYISKTQLTVATVFGTATSSWTARVNNPDGQSSGTQSIAVTAPPSSTVSQTFTSSSLTAAGVAQSGGCATSAFNPFTIGSLTVTAFASFAGPLVSVSAAGIGVATNACGDGGAMTSSSVAMERLRFNPGSTSNRYLGIQLDGLGGGGNPQFATLKFYNSSGVLLQPPTVLTGCRASNSNFYVDAGQTFAYVDIVATNRANGNESSFLIASINFCTAGPATSCVPTNIGTTPVDCL